MNTSSPVRSVWFSPADTILRIAHENPGYRLYVLPLCAGLVTLPTIALFANSEDILLGFTWASLIAFGPIAELMQVFVGAYLLRLTGRWFGGNAGSRSMQVAIAWGNVPIVVLAAAGLIAIGFANFHNEMSNEPLLWDASATSRIAAWSLLTIQVVLIAWSCIILIRGVAILQGFSTGRAILSIVSAWLIVAVSIASMLGITGYSHNIGRVFFGGLGHIAGFDAAL